MPVANQCTRCGACCRGRSGTVLVSDDDVARWRQGGKFGWIEGLVPGHFGCQALATSPNNDCEYLHRNSNRSTCTIHDHRPDTCASFEAMSPQCLDYRRTGGRD